MNKPGWMVALLFCFLSIEAKSAPGGYYEPIPYYGNDPFLFCTLGVPQDCWAPISPVTGAYVVTYPKCFKPYSALMFARVCPKAFPKGIPGQSKVEAPADGPAL